MSKPILPNELLWEDGELFDPWKWTPDDNCHGLYGQRYDCRPHLFKFLNGIERRGDKRDAEKRRQDFLDRLPSGETSITTIDAQMARRARRRRPPTKTWGKDAKSEKDFRETPELSWWMKVRPLPLQVRKILEERVASLRLERGEDVEFELHTGWEISRGDWD